MKLGGYRRAILAYYLEGKTANRADPTPVEFKKCIAEYCFVNDIEDRAHNVLVLPEVCIGKHKKFKQIQKMIWWLSVDNYNVMFGKLNRLKRWGIKSFLKHLVLNDYCSEADLHKVNIHLVQSYFAKDFIMNKGVEEGKTTYLSDYVNDIYTDADWHGEKRILLYTIRKKD